MAKLTEYFEKFKEIKGFTRDQDAADFLKVSCSYINRGKKTGQLTDNECVIIARTIDVHPALVIIAREMAKDKNQGYIKVWEDAFNACSTKLVAASKDYRNYRLFNIFNYLYNSFFPIASNCPKS